MARRYGSREGYRGGARRNSGARGSARRNSGGRGTGRSKGRIRAGKAVQYSIRDRRGNTKYVGTTNNPRRRSAEHRKSGKLGYGDSLVVETKAISRKSAESVERGKLASFRKRHGRNPRHNTTSDGRFHGRLKKQM